MAYPPTPFGFTMATPWTPRDRAVGNDMLPLLQLIAKNDRAVRTALAGQAAGAPPPPPSAQAPTAEPAPAPSAEQPDFAPIFTKMPRAQSRPEITRRQTTPLSPTGPAPEERPATRPAPAAQGLGEMLSGLSPDERQMMRQSMFAGMAGGLQDVLARRPNAGVGEMLLGIGTGGLGGQMQGRQMARTERRADLGTRLAEAQLGTAQAEAQRKQQEAQRIQALLSDPSTPPEMKQALEMSLSGLSGSAIQAVLPQKMSPYEQKSLELRERQIERQGQMTPYQQESLAIQRQRLERGGAGRPEIFGSGDTGYFTMGPDGKPQQLVAPAPPSASRARPQVFGSGEAGYYALGPDGKPQQLVAPVASTAGGGAGTALQRNAPFVAKALGISEGEATKMLLSPSGGRKTPEQMKLDLTEKLISSPRYMSNPEGAVQGAEEIMRMLEGGEAAAAPMVSEAPSEGWGDYISGFLPDFLGSESDTAEAAAAAPTADIDIENMSPEDLDALDPNSLSEEDRLRAADRWDVLNGG